MAATLLSCLAVAAVPAWAGVAADPGGGRQVPVVDCPITPGPATFTPPAVPATTVIPAPVSLPPGVTVFGTGDMGFPVMYSIAPAGFTCLAGGAGADGGFFVQVTQPAVRQHAIYYDYNPGGAGPNTDDACPYIPAAKSADDVFRRGTSQFCGHPAAERLTQVATGIPGLGAAIVEVPPTVKDARLPAAGDGQDETVAVYVARIVAGGSQADAQDANCTLPVSQKAVCLAALQNFVRQSLAASAAGPIFATLTAAIGGPASTHHTPPRGASAPSRSQLSEALPGRSQVPFTLPAVLKTLGVVVLLIMLVGFPAEIFNRTLEENYAEIRGWFGRLRPPASLTSRTRLRPMGQFAVFCVVAAAASTLVDPEVVFREAGWVGKGVVLFAGFLVAIPLTTLVYAVPGERYARQVSGVAARLRVLPLALVIAFAFVVISLAGRLMPGYVYGLVAGYAAVAGRKLTRAYEGFAVLLGACFVLAASLVVWVSWEPVRLAAARTHPTWPVLVLDAILSQAVILGLEAIVFGLLPMRYLDGGKLRGWNLWAWVAVYGTAAFFFVHLLVLNSRPVTQAQHQHAVFTVFTLFGAFAVFSLAFWGYFRFRPAAAGQQSRENAALGGAAASGRPGAAGSAPPAGGRAGLVHDASDAIVEALLNDGVRAVASRLHQTLGNVYDDRLGPSRQALTGLSGADLDRAKGEQATMWRVRLADFLDEHPEAEGRVARLAGDRRPRPAAQGHPAGRGKWAVQVLAAALTAVTGGALIITGQLLNAGKAGPGPDIAASGEVVYEPGQDLSMVVPGNYQPPAALAAALAQPRPVSGPLLQQIRNAGAIPVQQMAVRLVLRSSEKGDIKILNIRAVGMKRMQPPDGTFFDIPQRGVDTSTRLALDLGSPAPAALGVTSSGQTAGAYFAAHTMSIGGRQQHALMIRATSACSDVVFRIGVDYLAGGVRRTAVVSDHGKPFQLTGLRVSQDGSAFAYRHEFMLRGDSSVTPANQIMVNGRPACPAAGQASPGTPSSPGRVTVSVSPGASGYPDAAAITEVITNYFQAINDKDYALYQATETSIGLSRQQFDTAFRSSQDSAVTLTQITTANDGRPAADVTFTSRQQPQDGPQGEPCTQWHVTMFLDHTGSIYTIGAPPAGYHAAYQACP